MEKEAVTLENTDATDVNDMFAYAENTTTVDNNEEMKIVWESQKEFLASKDHRWHPR